MNTTPNQNRPLDPHIKQIILDYDDTIVFSGFRHHQAASCALQSFTGETISDRQWSEHCSGKTHSEIYNHVLLEHPGFASEKDFLARWQNKYHDNLSTLQARAGIHRLASAFFEVTGLQIPIVSNSMKSDVMHGLVITDLSDEIGTVYGSDTLRCLKIPSKPSAEALIRVAKMNGVTDPSSVLIIDDSSTVIKNAKHAGFITATFLEQCDLEGNHFENPPIDEADYNIEAGEGEMDGFIEQVISNLEMV